MTKIAKLKLSASRIKTFQNCSWYYYCKYILKIPEKENEGMHRGKIVHLVLEYLLKSKHKKHFEEILRGNHILHSPVIYRFICKETRKRNINTPENLDIINDMLLVGLKLDFYCKAAISIIPEEEFNYETDKYTITGFIDKLVTYKDGSIVVYDYKTNKSKYDKNEMDGNLQALMYSLICFKKNNVIPTIKFLFLRFPKDPELIVRKCTEEELSGFESYLSYLTQYLTNFNLNKATLNYAQNNVDTKWLCGFAREKGQLTKAGKVYYSCPYKFPLYYFDLINKKTKEVLKSSEDSTTLEENENNQILSKLYPGCPCHGYKISRKKESLPEF